MEDSFAYYWTPPPGWPRPRIVDPLDVIDIARETTEIAGGIEYAVGMLDADLGLVRLVVDPPVPTLGELLFPDDDEERIAPQLHGFFLITGEPFIGGPSPSQRQRFAGLRRSARELGLVFVDWVIADGGDLHSMRLSHRRERRHRRSRRRRCV